MQCSFCSVQRNAAKEEAALSKDTENKSQLRDFSSAGLPVFIPKYLYSHIDVKSIQGLFV